MDKNVSEREIILMKKTGESMDLIKEVMSM